MNVEKQQWVTISEDDHHTTSAMAVGYGAMVKNQSFEQRRIDGSRVTVQVSESMSYVPNVKVKQVNGVWILEPHYAGSVPVNKAPNL